MTETSCPDCHRVYDMLAYSVGEKLRCVCGKILIARAMGSAKRARSINCSKCGGMLEKGKANCPFCEALIDPVDVRYVVYCGGCLSLNKEGATYCSDCGEEIDAKPEQPKASNAPCPRCQARLRQRHLNELTIDECPICCGMFVEAKELNVLLAPHTTEGKESVAGKASKPRKAVLPVEEVKYLKCPICTQLMNRKNYGRVSGVMIDTCGKHGMWLDAGELEKIAAWVSTGGYEDMQRYEQTIEKMKMEAVLREAQRVQNLQIEQAVRRQTRTVWAGYRVIGSLLRFFS